MIRAALAVTVALCACTRNPDESPREASLQAAPARPASQAVRPGAPTPDEQRFVDAAAGATMFGLQAADLALARSRSQAVRQFAAATARDHRHASGELRKALAQSGKALVPAAALPTERQKDILKLTTVALAEFDRTYLEIQVEAHEDELQALERYGQAGEVPSLRAFAAATREAVERRHDHARKLLAQVRAR